MPTSTYPPRPGTVDGSGVHTISSFLNQPEYIRRRMADLTDQQFVGDRILTGRYTSTSGMAAYEVSEAIYADGIPETIEPGGVFPSVLTGVPQRIIEAISKIGLATEITLESVIRSNWMPVARAERKLANSIVLAFDTLVMAKIAAAAGDMKTFGASSWATATGGDILRHIMEATNLLTDARQGYVPDTLLITSAKWVELASNTDFMKLIRLHQGDSGPANIEAGIPMPGREPLRLLLQPTTDAQVTDPIVYDSRILGGIVRENALDGAGGDNGVGASSRYYTADEVSPDGQSEVWRLSVKRARQPIIQEPQAATIIVGT